MTDALEVARAAFQHARTGDTAAIAATLALGLPIDAQNEKGDTLLMLASYHGHADTVRMLLQRGASPEVRNDRGQTPLSGAVFKGALPVVRLLLTHGADTTGAAAVATMFGRTDVLALLQAV